VRIWVEMVVVGGVGAGSGSSGGVRGAGSTPPLTAISVQAESFFCMALVVEPPGRGVCTWAALWACHGGGGGAAPGPALWLVTLHRMAAPPDFAGGAGGAGGALVHLHVVRGLATVVMHSGRSAGLTAGLLPSAGHRGSGQRRPQVVLWGEHRLSSSECAGACAALVGGKLAAWVTSGTRLPRFHLAAASLGTDPATPCGQVKGENAPCCLPLHL
jgi:hypothetical protein